MSELVTAIYENGLLRPLRKLHLQEQQTVLIRIEPQSGDEIVDRITAELVLSGILSLPEPTVDSDKYISDDELGLLSFQVGSQLVKPFSEIIIEERGYSW